MATTDTLYCPRFLSPEWIEQSRTNTVKCRVYRDGALSAPTSGTLTVYNASAAAVVDAQTVTISGAAAEYAIASATLASETLSDGWLFEWSLVMADGLTHVFRTEGGMVRRRLYPVITDDDLSRRHSDLSDLRPSSMTSYQDYIDEAWAEIENRLLSEGNRPYLIISPSAFREVHLAKTLEIVFRDFSTSVGDGRWWEFAEQYQRAYAIAWNRLRFRYDTDDDGQPDADDTRRSGSSTIWLNGDRINVFRFGRRSWRR